MRTIDAHGHIIVEEITASRGNEPWRPRIERTPQGAFSTTADGRRNGPHEHESTDVPQMLRDLDQLRIDTLLVSPPPYLFFYQLDPAETTRAARIQNDALASLKQAHPDRFAPLATVPLNDVDAAIAELRRATRELGLHGVEIGSSVQGVHLGDPRFRPFWRAVADDDVFVFIHPDYFQTNNSPALREYYLVNFVGNPTETGLTAAHMVFSGLFQDFPDLKILLAHAGGVTPWIMGRWAHGYGKRAEAKRDLKHNPLEDVKKFYFDTIAHSPAALEFLIEQVGADHVILGSDYFFDMGPDDPIGDVERLEGVSEADKAKILNGNITTLARL
ncbi:MAG TPA: amidohydrolase family protein [Ktedonobacterales bacterium]|nr:amidohydrolase family protein [Ktedonobacterales bacterium]